MFGMFFLLILLLLTSPVEATSVDIKIDKGRKIEKEKSQSDRKTIEEKKLKGKRQEQSSSQGEEQKQSQSLEETKMEEKAASVHYEITMEDLFVPHVIFFEQRGELDRLFGRPWTTADVGIDISNISSYIRMRRGETYGPVSDTLEAMKVREIMGNFAKAGEPVNRIIGGDYVNDRLNAFKESMLIHGEVIALASRYLHDDISSSMEEEKGKFLVFNLGEEEIKSLAGDAVKRAIQDVKNKKISAIASIAISYSECLFAGDLNSFLCGNSYLTITPNTLKVAGIDWFIPGSGVYGGKKLHYRINRTWSLRNALENLKMNSKFKQWAEEVSKYADELESQGQTRESILLRKKAYEIAKRTGQTVPLKNLLPK